MSIKKRIAADGRPMYLLPGDRNYVIPGDIHFPIHSNLLVKWATQPVDINNALFLQGDTGDAEAFSRFPKDPEQIAKSHSMRRERECWKRWLGTWMEQFDELYIAPGNHEGRVAKLLMTSPAFIGLNWWFPYQDLFNDPKITVLDIGYRAKIGRNIYVEHGDLLRGATGKCPAASVAEHNPGNHTIIFGHTHRVAHVNHTTYRNGNPQVCTALNTGHCQDTRRNGYASNPNWQPGRCTITEGQPRLEWL
jgi:predicted phosphodiesterase